MRLLIDTSACTGHGRCYSDAPEVADADDAGRGVPVHDELPDGMEQFAQIAVDTCPEYAIRIER